MTGFTYSAHEDIKKYQRMKKIFKDGEKVISKEQKEKYLDKNWKKLHGLMRKERNKRKIVLQKINEIKDKIRELKRKKPTNYMVSVKQLMRDANKIAVKWYNKILYKSVAK